MAIIDSARVNRLRKPRLGQEGFTLIEVMVALVVFAIAGAATLSTVNALFSANARNHAAIMDQSVAQDLSSMAQGSSALLSTMNGLVLTRATAAPSGVPLLGSWWQTTQATNPFIQTIQTRTSPATCVANIPCLMSITITSKPPFSAKVIDRTFEIQEMF